MFFIKFPTLFYIYIVILCIYRNFVSYLIYTNFFKNVSWLYCFETFESLALASSGTPANILPAAPITVTPRPESTLAEVPRSEDIAVSPTVTTPPEASPTSQVQTPNSEVELSIA